MVLRAFFEKKKIHLFQFKSNNRLTVLFTFIHTFTKLFISLRHLWGEKKTEFEFHAEIHFTLLKLINPLLAPLRTKTISICIFQYIAWQVNVSFS